MRYFVRLGKIMDIFCDCCAYLCSHRKYIKIPVMKKIISLLILVLIGVMNLSASDKSIFWLGADISGTTELEARGVQLYNAAGEPVKIPNL